MRPGLGQQAMEGRVAGAELLEATQVFVALGLAGAVLQI